MYFLDDLCRIISLFSAPFPDKWDLSVKGGDIHIDPQTGVIELKMPFAWSTVFGTKKMVIGPSNIYPCIHEWFFDQISIKKCIVGLYFVDGDIEKKGNGSFRAYRYSMNDGCLYEPGTMIIWPSSPFKQQRTRPSSLQMTVNEKTASMYIGVDGGEMQLAHKIKRNGTYLMAVSLRRWNDKLRLKSYQQNTCPL